MKRAPPRQSIRLHAKYKAYLHIIKYFIEARLESNLDNSSKVSHEGAPEVGESSQNNPGTPPQEMSDRMERDDEDDFRP